MHAIHKTDVRFVADEFICIRFKEVIACFFEITGCKIGKVVKPDRPGKYFKLIESEYRVDGYLFSAPDPKKYGPYAYTDLQVILELILVDQGLN